MALRDRVRAASAAPAADGSRNLFKRFGLLANPFPPSSQTTNNPHRPTDADEEIDEKIESFIRDHKTQVAVIEGPQGTGKTNILNHYEAEIAALHASGDLPGFYVIRYLADPEASFEGTIRRLFQELGIPHIQKLAEALRKSDKSAIEDARSVEVRTALRNLGRNDLSKEDLKDTSEALLEWLLGMRLLKAHRQLLGVNFRLDTVEAKTAALRDIVIVSSRVDILKGIFLLLDELEKQDGVLSPSGVVKYLSALRAIIDALPNHLFMMIAVTPDALRRYSVALPAFRSRLQDRVELSSLTDAEDAVDLARFYLTVAEEEAAQEKGKKPATAKPILTDKEISAIFSQLLDRATKGGDTGLRQRTFLHHLYQKAESRIQGQA
jgi:AAA+ ATPase superfamily predicted ATPase